jgi:hypothetical protein
MHSQKQLWIWLVCIAGVLGICTQQLLLWREPAERLDMPLPLNEGSESSSSYLDFGYPSADPSSKAYWEISRALNDKTANYTSDSRNTKPPGALPKSSLSSGPIKEISVFDRVNNLRFWFYLSEI